jgi:hypothetical protein
LSRKRLLAGSWRLPLRTSATPISYAVSLRLVHGDAGGQELTRRQNRPWLRRRRRRQGGGFRCGIGQKGFQRAPRRSLTAPPRTRSTTTTLISPRRSPAGAAPARQSGRARRPRMRPKLCGSRSRNRVDVGVALGAQFEGAMRALSPGGEAQHQRHRRLSLSRRRRRCCPALMGARRGNDVLPAGALRLVVPVTPRARKRESRLSRPQSSASGISRTMTAHGR